MDPGLARVGTECDVCPGLAGVVVGSGPEPYVPWRSIQMLAQLLGLDDGALQVVSLTPLL